MRIRQVKFKSGKSNSNPASQTQIRQVKTKFDKSKPNSTGQMRIRQVKFKSDKSNPNSTSQNQIRQVKTKSNRSNANSTSHLQFQQVKMNFDKSLCFLSFFHLIFIGVLLDFHGSFCEMFVGFPCDFHEQILLVYSELSSWKSLTTRSLGWNVFLVEFYKKILSCNKVWDGIFRNRTRPIMGSPVVKKILSCVVY